MFYARKPLFIIKKNNSPKSSFSWGKNLWNPSKNNHLINRVASRAKSAIILIATLWNSHGSYDNCNCQIYLHLNVLLCTHNACIIQARLIHICVFASISYSPINTAIVPFSWTIFHFELFTTLLCCISCNNFFAMAKICTFFVCIEYYSIG